MDDYSDATVAERKARQWQTHLAEMDRIAKLGQEQPTSVLAGVVEIDYTNHRGERGIRRILPDRDGLRYGTNKYHTTPCWCVFAYCFKSRGQRTFPIANIHAWKEVT